MPVDRSVVDAQLEALGDFYRFFTSKEIRYLPEILTDGEIIRGITSGLFEQKTWIVVITTHRILFLDKGMFFGLKQVDMPLAQIDSVSHHTGMFFGELKIATSAGAKTIGAIAKKDVIKIASVITQILHGDSPKAEPKLQTLAVSEQDLVSQLERLAALHERGALSDEEFRLGKAALLDFK